MRVRRKSTEVVWTRTRSSTGPGREAIRVRRDGGDWQDVATPDDLPSEIRDLLEEFSSDEPPADGGATETIAPLLPPRRPRKPRRRRVRATERDESLELEYVWFEGCAVIAAAIAALAALYYGIDAIAGNSRSLAPWAGWLTVLFSLMMAYFGLATLVNRTTITIADGHLTVRHGPLPWFRSRDIPVDDVRQLYCTVYRGGRHSGLRWRLSAHTDNEGDVELLDHIRTKDEAVSLERAIERHLGIPDWPRFGD